VLTIQIHNVNKNVEDHVFFKLVNKIKHSIRFWNKAFNEFGLNSI